MIVTSAMTRKTRNTTTSAIIIGTVFVMVVMVGTTSIGNIINSQALPYLRKIANNVVAMLTRVVAAAAAMMEQATLMRALKYANRHLRQASWLRNNWTRPSPCSKLKT